MGQGYGKLKGRSPTNIIRCKTLGVSASVLCFARARVLEASRETLKSTVNRESLVCNSTFFAYSFW